MNLPTQRLSDVLDQLGYADEPGLIDADLAAPGARDFVWQPLRDRCEVQAAYFRGAVPLVAFLETDSSVEAARAQQRLWNFGRVPILLVVTGDEVRAMSCALTPQPTDADATTLGFHSGSGPMHTLAAFQRRSVERGEPTSLYPRQLSNSQTVSSRLLRNLRDLQARLHSVDLSPQETERLIGRSIFIRFLEDRKILTPAHLSEISPFETFLEVLGSSSAQLEGLFEELANRFNGDAFSPPIGSTAVSIPAMHAVADFLSGGSVSTGQQSFIPYDFSIIPSDLVSGVYEQLLQKEQRKTAAFYTPRRLVDLVLDEALPLDNEDEPVRILDPACGSGIFLSEAFKRLAYRRSRNQDLSYQELGQLLSSSIFGVDVSETAIGVASFGLDLALLEYADPPTAWDTVRLPTLVGQNLHVADFFDPQPFDGEPFDVVVGNPPWLSALTAPARSYVKNRTPSISVPDNQIATAFLWKAFDHLQPNGVFALVLPAKPLLHNRTGAAIEFRSQLYSRADISTVFDLSPLRSHLFGSATAPAAVAIGRPGPPASAAPDVLLLSPRRSPLAEMADGLVFSSEDIHVVPLSLAEHTPDIWKTLLWGTFADVEFIRGIRDSFSSLKDFAREYEWKVGQGFQIKGGDENPADHLLGLPILPVESVEPLRITEHEGRVVTSALMHRPRKREIFIGPHILLRKGFGSVPVIAFSDHDFAHADSVFSIAGPERDADTLRAVAALLNSSFAQYFYFMTSSSWGVEREQLQLAEYLTLPVPHSMHPSMIQALAGIEQTAAVGTPRSDWQGLLDDIAADLYGLSQIQRDLVTESVELRMSQYTDPLGSAAFAQADDTFLDAYCRTLAETISIYLPSFDAEVKPTRGPGELLAVTCSLDSSQGLDGRNSVKRILEGLSPAESSSLDGSSQLASIIEPTAIILSDRSVHVVKPDERRFWSRSCARDDSRLIIAAILDSRQGGTPGSSSR